MRALQNNLPREDEHSSIHWHGIRLPNDQDGVPYLTQQPVWPGEEFSYSFVPPDTGTFFFHPHCDTAQQLGRGMAGVLIVEGDESEPYDADVPIVLRDWRIDDAGDGFLPFFTPDGAGKGGTFGTVRSANGEINPEIVLPASGDCRLRLLNLDNTRVMEVGVEGAEAAIVAIDGIALPPLPLKSWRFGPAMRLDIVVRAPADGETVRLVDYFRRRARAARPADRQGRGAAERGFRSGAASRRAYSRGRPGQRRAPAVHLLRHRRRRCRRRGGGGGAAARFALQRRRDFLGDQQKSLAGRRSQPRARTACDPSARPLLCLRAPERDAAPAPDSPPRA